MKYILISLGFLFVMISVFSCKNNNDTYKKPYKPGVYVDKESLAVNKQLWEENKIKNYTYTYSYKYKLTKNASGSLHNYIIDVTVENGEVCKYVLKEYDGNTEQNVSSEDWNYYKENLNTYVLKNDTNFFLIENIYKKIDDIIKVAFDAFKEIPDSYYKEIGFEFTEDIPCLLSYYCYNLIMEKDLVGNSGCEEFKIENFKSL